MNMSKVLYYGRPVNFDEIIGTAKYHHSALEKGYVSRKLECIIENYSGKFGKRIQGTVSELPEHPLRGDPVLYL